MGKIWTIATESVVWLSLVALVGGDHGGAVTLVENGQAQSTILIPPDADERVSAAAGDLQYHLRKMSGAEVPITTQWAEGQGVRLWVGTHPPDFLTPIDINDPEAVWPDGYYLLQSDEDLFLLAPRPEGVANAIYGLLEDHLGCHWFTPGEIGEYIPARATVQVEIPGGYEVRKPRFEMRAPWYNGNVTGQLNAEESAQMKRWWTRNRHGGARGYGGHNWSSIYTPEVQEQEPELAPFFNGRRHPGQGQICMSHPRAAEIAAQFFIQLFNNNPGLDHYSFSQNDGGGWCECERCQAMASNNGARMLLLSNRVAEMVAQVHPSKRITILPYAGTIEPPEEFIVGHPNLDPIICSFGMEQVQPKTTAGNSWCDTYRQRVERWMTMLPRAWSYDYIGWYPGPWTLFAKLQSDQDYYRSLGYTGLMDEYLGRNMGTDIHLWLSLRTAWDGNLRVADLLGEFYPAYFGAAAEDMRSVYEMFEQQMLSVGGTGEMMDVPRLYPLDMVERALETLAQAKQQVGDNATIVARLERDENCLRLTKRWLNFWSALGQFRRSNSNEDRDRTVAQAQAYLDLVRSLEGTLTAECGYNDFVAQTLKDLNDPGTYFAEPGEFSYQDGLDDGGKIYQAQSYTGFYPSTYGLYLAPGVTGEIVYDFRTGEGLCFQEAHLVNLCLSLPEGGHNRVEISRDQGRSWTTVSEDMLIWAGKPGVPGELDLTEWIAGANRFLLKFWIQNPDRAPFPETLGMDCWGIRGIVGE